MGADLPHLQCSEIRYYRPNATTKSFEDVHRQHRLLKWTVLAC
jgi:hypothetical protein